MKSKFNTEDAYQFYLRGRYSNKQKAVTDYCAEKGIEEKPGYRSMLSRRVASKSTGSNFKNDKIPSKAKVLVFDLETAPLSAYLWGVWNQNIGHNLDMVTNDWFMLTWSAKWLFEDRIISAKLTPEEAINEDDSRIITHLWHLIDEADVIIAHNALKFDIKKMNARFLLNGLMPPSNYEVIDTLVHARKKFALTSNKLDYISNILNVGRKVKHEGFSMWKSCMKGDAEALDKMSYYNEGDVTILEEVYLKLRSWIKPHPNLGFYIMDDVSSCPTCGSEDLKWDGKVYRTYVNEYPVCRCGNCGAESRGKKTVTTNSKNLLVSTPR